MTHSHISLVDNTLLAPQAYPDNNSESSSFRPPPKALSHRLTKGSVREGLARRKYAKWQHDRFTEETDESSPDNSDRSNARLLPKGKGRGRSRSRGDAGPATTTTDGAEEQAGGAEESRSTSAGDKPEFAIDILYENQRGWFFFGIPLYSRQSLLNLDPAGWQTRDYKFSPVDVTNAQLPDPSWEWEWRAWYVDMSYDVDEEGWQYSFSFSSKFAWHGTQPWFHSFVRRRRWLRKRARRAKVSRKGEEVEASHMMNDEYFTIHPSVLRSRESSADPMNAARSSFVSRRSAQQDDYLIQGDVADVLALMKCLKTAQVDREKIDVVKRFVAQGGDDLIYLAERIPDIMAFFIFQHSRRLLIDYLQGEVENIRQSRAEGSAQADTDAEVEARKLDYLRKAVEAAETHIMESEYWSDIRAVTEGNDRSLLDDRHGPGKVPQYDGSAGDIQGIPEEAKIGVDEGLGHLVSQH